MIKINKILILSVILFCGFAHSAMAYQPKLIFLQTGDIKINNPEISQYFYDDLKGKPRVYFINSDKDFELYLNILVPEAANRDGRYSANVFSINGDKEEMIFSTDILSSGWSQFYESFGRDYYLKGPEFDKQVSAGKYKIEIFTNLPAQAGENQGKYILVVGKKEFFDIPAILNIYWQLPLLKITFFNTSVLQFFLTPFGIAGIGAVGGFLIIIALLYYIFGAIKASIRHHMAKTLLLTSNGMQMKEEIIKLLQKPAYDITVAFIVTAAKPVEDLEFLKKDWDIMREMGFNVEEIDIEGKKEAEVMKLLELKDIIFVEGGNTFYLLKAMRACHFEKIIRKLLKEGKVYVGAGEGSIVAGKKGLKLVPFDIFLHFKPEDANIIIKKMPWKWQRRKLKILTDEQAILVQGREVSLIGKGSKIVI